MTSTIEAVFFDVGRTLYNRGGPQDFYVQENNLPFVDYCRKTVNMTPEELMKSFWFQATYGNKKSLTGIVKGDDFKYDSMFMKTDILPYVTDPKIKKALESNKLISIQEICLFSQVGARLIMPMINMIKRLRNNNNNNVKIGIISDLIDFGFEREFGQFYSPEHDDEKFENIKYLFDDIIKSFDVGICKRENASEILQLACKRLNVNPNNCIFIDDGAHNIEIARGLGMTGFLIDVMDRSNLYNVIESVERLCGGGGGGGGKL